MIAAIWKTTFATGSSGSTSSSFAALIVYVVRSVLSPKRARSEDKTPPNLTPFLDDDDLESRRLERVQGWALLFAAIVAVALPLYWLHEPNRQHESDELLRQERGRPAARSCSRTPRCPDVQPGEVAAVRELPRRHGRRRRRAHHAQRRQGQLAGAAAQHGVLAVRGGPRLPRAGRADSRGTVCDVTTSSPTAGPAPRCSRGVSPAAARRTSSRSRTSCVHRVDPAHAAQSQAQETEALTLAKSDDPNDSRARST